MLQIAEGTYGGRRGMALGSRSPRGGIGLLAPRLVVGRIPPSSSITRRRSFLSPIFQFVIKQFASQSRLSGSKKKKPLKCIPSSYVFLLAVPFLYAPLFPSKVRIRQSPIPVLCRKTTRGCSPIMPGAHVIPELVPVNLNTFGTAMLHDWQITGTFPSDMVLLAQQRGRCFGAPVGALGAFSPPSPPPSAAHSIAPPIPSCKCPNNPK